MTPDLPLTSAMQSAAAAMQRHLGLALTLDDPVVLKDGNRNRVIRCRVSCPARPDLAFAIVKQIRTEPARGFNDWASLAFLAGIPETAELAPGFYGGDAAAGLFVMADLGGVRSVDDALRGADAAAARAALLALAAQTARLHRGTLGREAAFVRLRATLPEAAGLSRQQEAAQWQAALPRIGAWLGAAGCTVPAGLDAVYAGLAATYADPGPWLAFTHGDMAPTNNHLAGDQVRLLDFEYGAFRHALYDMTAWAVLCPLPEPLVAELRETYRMTLAAGFPGAGDLAGFTGAWADLCAYRALAMLTWIPPSILQADRPWVDDWTMRAAVRATLGRLYNVASPRPHLAPLAALADRLDGVLRAQWAELTAIWPRWPALDGPEAEDGRSPE